MGQKKGGPLTTDVLRGHKERPNPGQEPKVVTLKPRFTAAATLKSGVDEV